MLYSFLLFWVLAMSVPKIEGGDTSFGLQPEVCVHHKTGSVLAKEALTMASLVAEIWQGPPWSWQCRAKSFLPALDSLAVGHFIRDPFEVIVSGILYHAAGEEPVWTESALPSGHDYHMNCPQDEALTKCAILPLPHYGLDQFGRHTVGGCPDASEEDFAKWCPSVEPAQSGEAYAKYLTRMLKTNHTYDAVVVEMIRFEAFDRSMLLSALEICPKAHHTYNYCLHKIKDNAAFNTSMTGIFELWSFPPHLMTTLLDKLQVLDYTNPSHPQEHSTTHEGNIRERLLEDARKADSALFGGRYKQLQQSVQALCDGHPR